MPRKDHAVPRSGQAISGIVLRVVSAIFLICAFGAAPSPAQEHTRSIHVFVALADNQFQGIVPVPERLGNGIDPAHNLYWGAAFGVKTYFKASQDWSLIWSGTGPNPSVLERCVFKYRNSQAYLTADAYQGSQIRSAVTDFLSAAAGLNGQTLSVKIGEGEKIIPIFGMSDLVVYVGHDAFMDFQIPKISGRAKEPPRKAIILACASREYFGPYMRETGAIPLLWTTGLMAPEAYTLKAALDAWMLNEKDDAIRLRAAQADDRYQHCGLHSAERLFASGW